jgi:hypothetical protein
VQFTENNSLPTASKTQGDRRKKICDFRSCFKGCVSVATASDFQDSGKLVVSPLIQKLDIILFYQCRWSVLMVSIITFLEDLADVNTSLASAVHGELSSRHFQDSRDSRRKSAISDLVSRVVPQWLPLPTSKTPRG